MFIKNTTACARSAVVRGLTCKGDEGADGAVELRVGYPEAPVVPPKELPVAAIAAPAIKLAKAPGVVGAVGGLGADVDPGMLEGPGVAIGTTLAVRGVLLLGLLGRQA